MVFESDIANEQAAQIIRPLLQHHPQVMDFHIDLADAQRVLCINGSGALRAEHIEHLFKSVGYRAVLLRDE